VHPATERFTDLLRQAGVAGEVREFDDSTRTAALAAAALGCPVGAIANSLVFIADGEPLLIFASGAHRVDTARVAASQGWTELRRASPEEVRASTGQVIGGVAPIGHPEKLAALIDSALRHYGTIWASAGTPHAVFATTFAELTRLAEARELIMTEDPEPPGSLFTGRDGPPTAGGGSAGGSDRRASDL
jgi:prolyl-tRNA editing enzyme YbaK/EbsC (Cys-tRNA(Pro) deacylase)